MFAFGFGAVASVPQSSIVQLDEPMPHSAGDEPLPHPAHVAVMIYVLATPEPAPTPQYAPFVARPMAAIAPFSGPGNGFDYGYCTWWVAQKRHIPWRGNAVEWWWNARAFGFAEGPAPRAGAIMVMGISGTSSLGHVAYVESVRPDGSFLVSEMNWWGVPGGGWNRVDYRTVTSMRGVLGFIY